MIPPLSRSRIFPTLRTRPDRLSTRLANEYHFYRQIQYQIKPHSLLPSEARCIRSDTTNSLTLNETSKIKVARL